ncbi:hypothetical protein ABZW30_13345 [Kitasatospora sp. NPDC004669]|uniref:hypothetical protein n=1 Tax=Kitasatospora sp. NPDC004669 TaxID=3154555 RepID=UPI0033B5A869
MPARVRTKRTNNRPALRLSTIRPSELNVRSAEVMTIVCRDCRTWQRLMGATTLKIRDHYVPDGGEKDEHGKLKAERLCQGARQVVDIDIDVAKWQRAQDRRISPDAMPAETRRSARQHYKPLPPVAAPVHRIAAPGPAVAAPSVASRVEQWTQVRLPVLVADTKREIPLEDAIGPIRGAQAPTTTLRPAA